MYIKVSKRTVPSRSGKFFISLRVGGCMLLSSAPDNLANSNFSCSNIMHSIMWQYAPIRFGRGRGGVHSNRLCSHNCICGSKLWPVLSVVRPLTTSDHTTLLSVNCMRDFPKAWQSIQTATESSCTSVLKWQAADCCSYIAYTSVWPYCDLSLTIFWAHLDCWPHLFERLWSSNIAWLQLQL